MHLAKQQMQSRIHQSCEWKYMFQNDPNFLKTVIEGYEIWVHHFDPFTKSSKNVCKHTYPPPYEKKNTHK